MFYRIIHDEEKLNAFVDWLPELKDDEAFYFCLFARKKYCPDVGWLSSDKQQLARKTVTSKDRLVEKIKQLEIPLDRYVQHGRPVPQESLVLYITPNPRSLESAAKNLAIKMVQLVTKPYGGYNPHQEAMSEIQKACGTKHVIDFDFDTDDVDSVITQAKDILRDNQALTFVRTRGGVHVLVHLAHVPHSLRKEWHPRMARIPGCDVRGDGLLPVPGCTQGGFTPYML